MIEPLVNTRMDLRTTVLRAIAGRPRSRTFAAVPDASRFEAFAMLFLLAMVVAICVAWYVELAKPIGCQTSPLFFRFGGSAEATMVVRSDMRCPVFVHTGSAALDEPTTLVEPMHGTLTPRGRTGVYYRPQSGFTGTDVFAIALSGRTITQSGTMTIRVNVTVQ